MKAVKILKVLVMIAAVCLFGAFVVMHLWNWLMPSIFGLKALSFAQSLGLLVLSKILLGGFHRHAGGRPPWKRGWQDRWDHMSPDEREKFREGMKARWNCRPQPEPQTREVSS